MKQSDIDKRIEELTNEALALESQRETLAALDVCMKRGHECALTDVRGDEIKVNYVELTCKVCGAWCAPGSADERWLFQQGGFEGKFVDEVYEIENTEPLPEPEPIRTETPVIEEEPDVIRDTGDVQIIDETDTKGFYRVKFGNNE